MHDARNWAGSYYGLTPTRQELAAAVASHTGIPGLRELILSSSWGSPLKPCAFRGDLCFGPSQGQNITFVNQHCPLPAAGSSDVWVPFLEQYPQFTA